MREPKTFGQVTTELNRHAERLLTTVLTPNLVRLRRLLIGEAERVRHIEHAVGIFMAAYGK